MRNILYLDRDIDDRLARVFIRRLYELPKSKPIYVVINSQGGEVAAGMAIYDAIKTQKGRTTGVVYGEAQSMASLILQAFDRRIVMPNAKIMLHGSIGAVDDNGIVKQISQLRYAAKEEGRLDMIYLEQIRKKIPSFTFKQLRAKLNKDWYLTAEETVKLGLADEIGE